MKTLTLSLLTAAFIAPLASAGLVTATFNNVAPGAVVNYTLLSPSGGGGTHAGRFNWTVNANTGASLGPTFTAFCIELTQNVGFNQQVIYTETALDQAPDPAGARDALEARQPLGRMVRSTEVAAAILYLASDETAATGLELRLDAGLTGVLASAPDRSRAGGGTYSTQVRGG